MKEAVSDEFFAKSSVSSLRSTQQFLLPVEKAGSPEDSYDIYPAIHTEGKIWAGYATLADWIAERKSNIIADGFSGVYWEIFIQQIDGCLKRKGITAHWINVNDALKHPAEIAAMTNACSGGEDPLFGKVYGEALIEFFDNRLLYSLSPLPGRLNIIYGCGASLAGWTGSLIYLEVPKNEIQFRSRAGKIKNLGCTDAADAKVQYKRFYFIDWPVLSKHKSCLLKRIDVIVDEQRVTEITWTTGKILRQVLKGASGQVFRTRPWFEPGVWGGRWLKDHIGGLNKQVKNYAWSFELISPENGILIENNGILLEVSFDMLLFLNSYAVLGKAAARFGNSFPIRFDFLDTVDGGNLSLQCHPSVAYTASNFGEPYTQDETYYILDSGPNAKVYLGFHENIRQDKFRAELEDSFYNNVPMNIENYVQTFHTKKHDLFLIPNGTVHCSGKDNMVLEISATPYIYTFKIYDWLRLDLNGQIRPLNIERAFENLRFDRQGAVVSDTLISKQEVVTKGDDWRVIGLSTHPEHFYAVERVEFDFRLTCQTQGQCHVLSLVEGGSISVRTGDVIKRIHYAETFIVPAAAACYELVNNGSTTAKVVRAFVKDQNC